jgi:Subtilase family
VVTFPILAGRPHRPWLAGTLCAYVRRLTVIGVLLLACAAPAHAALPFHPGHAILPASSGSSTVRSLRAYPRTLVELDHAGNGGAEFALSQAGGRLIAPEIALWRVSSAAAVRLLPGLRAQGVVRSVAPDMPLRPSPWSALVSPLAVHTSEEWWIPHVGADRWTPPGPGVPLTMIDSGVDLSHAEFVGRPDTTALNQQSFSANEEELHGTATASIAAAPGKGIFGIYPRAKLQLWDASPAGVLTVGDEIAGLFDAIKHGRTVVNLSLGGFDRIPIEEHAILAVFGAGSLVVASAGNDREIGSPLSYPASFAHVLTVGATDESDQVSDFSSASSHMDLAAPGQDMVVAVPEMYAQNPPDDYDTFDGTSFSAPLVSGAAAAIWTLRPTLTNTQLFEVMRRSAHHLSKRGWNRNTGYGILDAPAAVTRKAPAADPQEPNEDIYLVKPNGLFKSGHAALTFPGRPNRVLAAHVERDDDSEDVYRAYLPAKGRLVVTLRTNANVTLQAWGKRTTTVFERGAAARRDLLGISAHAGKRRERLVIPGRGVGQYVYLDVFLAKPAAEANYTIRAATVRP